MVGRNLAGNCREAKNRTDGELPRAPGPDIGRRASTVCFWAAKEGGQGLVRQGAEGLELEGGEDWRWQRNANATSAMRPRFVLGYA